MSPHLVYIAAILGLTVSAAQAHEVPCPASDDYSIGIHGGAGVILRKNMSAEREAEYRAALTSALEIGGAMLARGDSALDAVEAIIVTLEDDPKFNAGKGAVFSAAGQNELDAAIMDGANRNAGAVSAVLRVKNPIRLARAVMDHSRHVMLQGEGAEQFAKTREIEMVEPSYFFTKRRYDQLKKKLKRKKDGAAFDLSPQTRFGTVGAVVRDGCGNLAAGTSTGGLTAKEFGRVGDTPIIGAGTYADNRYCAVSATGTGEYFIRATVARDICARREFLNETIQDAADHLIHETLPEMGGDGGVVAMDDQGRVAYSFNTDGMYRGQNSGGDISVRIFKKD